MHKLYLIIHSKLYNRVSSLVWGNIEKNFIQIKYSENFLKYVILFTYEFYYKTVNKRFQYSKNQNHI